MKRPFAVIGITYLLSQAVAAYLGAIPSLAVGICMAFLLILYFFFDIKHSSLVLTIAITVFIAMLSFFAYTKIHVEKVIPVEGESAYIKGQIIEEPYEQYGRFYYIIKTDEISIDNVRQKTKIRVSSKNSIEAEFSDVFYGEVCFTSINDENTLHSKKRLLSKGIMATAYVVDENSCYISEGKSSAYNIAVFMRKTLKSNITELFSDDIGNILIAMMTGDESYLNDDTVTAFRNTGISHILAVSGLHLSLIALALTWFLRRFLINRKIIAVIVCIITWLFVAVAGFPMSSIRAAIMITVMLFGILVNRLHTPLNSLGIALLIICLINPYAAIDVGLLMSFSSTFGLIVAAPELNRYIQRILFKDKSGIAAGILRKIVSSVVCSLTASIFILPVSVLCFGKVSILSPISNLMLIPIAELFLGIGMLTVFFSFFGNIGKFIAYPLMAIDWFIGKLLSALVKMFDNIPGSVLNTGENTAIIVFGCILIGCLWAILFSRRGKRASSFITSAFCCVIIVFVWFISGYTMTDSKTITIYDVGNAQMILARDRQSAILLGAGGKSYDVSLAQYDMQDKGLSEISALILTDMSESGAACADAVINNMNPCEIFISENGSFYDTVKYTADKKSIAVYDSADMSVSTGSVKVSTNYDAEGKLWSCIECNKIKIIVCPDEVDCLYCPFGFEADAVVISDKTPACLAAIDAKAYIVSADYSSGAVIVSQLMARGIENVYCTGINGNIEFAMRDGRLYIGGENV